MIAKDQITSMGVATVYVKQLCACTVTRALTSLVHLLMFRLMLLMFRLMFRLLSVCAGVAISLNKNGNHCTMRKVQLALRLGSSSTLKTSKISKVENTKFPLGRGIWQRKLWLLKTYTLKTLLAFKFLLDSNLILQLQTNRAATLGGGGDCWLRSVKHRETWIHN